MLSEVCTPPTLFASINDSFPTPRQSFLSDRGLVYNPFLILFFLLAGAGMPILYKVR